MTPVVGKHVVVVGRQYNTTGAQLWKPVRAGAVCVRETKEKTGWQRRSGKRLYACFCHRRRAWTVIRLANMSNSHTRTMDNPPLPTRRNVYSRRRCRCHYRLSKNLFAAVTRSPRARAPDPCARNILFSRSAAVNTNRLPPCGCLILYTSPRERALITSSERVTRDDKEKQKSSYKRACGVYKAARDGDGEYERQQRVRCEREKYRGWNERKRFFFFF